MSLPGYIYLKNAIKYIAGCTAVATAFLNARSPLGHACILVCHRVANIGVLGTSVDNWNVSVDRFQRLARWLADKAECIPLHRLLEHLASARSSRPLVALTFDDGFCNFRYNVLPILHRYRLPATIFVPTRYVGSPSPFPFDSWGQKVHSRSPFLAWRPISWPELQECVDTSLVCVGSHSHNHFAAFDCTDEELLEEAMVSRNIIQSRLCHRSVQKGPPRVEMGPFWWFKVPHLGFQFNSLTSFS
jgi:peptidoglycan/xylan/chitin deacetylase (PgdA/CDA1 family)